MSSRTRPQCFITIPATSESLSIEEAVREAARGAGFRVTPPKNVSLPLEKVAGEIARADCVIADITNNNATVFYELGIAQSMKKALFLLAQSDTSYDLPTDLQGQQFLRYNPTVSGLSDLRKELESFLRTFRNSPRPVRSVTARTFTAPFFVDWARLDRTDTENLIFELLTQMGFQRVDWIKGRQEIDLIAELPRKDPDGFEYRELWLVGTGRNAPLEMLIDLIKVASYEPEYLLHRLNYDKRAERLRMSSDNSITLLLIMLDENFPSDELERLAGYKERRSRGGNIRIRVWDRNYLTSLIHQFPQIGYKYFSDEGRSQSKYRKTPEEFYRENVDLTNRLTATIAALEEEKNRRVRAERDAVWKDISFSAAHKLGNPIFAIETILDPLQKRVEEQRTEDAIKVVARIRESIEKAKNIVDQFKSLARAQNIQRVTMPLRPILDDACQMARDQGIVCEVECPTNFNLIGDPDRLAECFDELVSNAAHWFDKPNKEIHILVSQPTTESLPQSIDTSQKYTLIQVRDSGSGVPLDNKEKIFNAFFTTRDQGTGLGLATVRRIIEGHEGYIFENGIPGQGANFEIYLPMIAQTSTTTISGKTRSRREKGT